MTYPLKVWQSIKSGVAPDVNALSTLILAGTVLLVVLTQSKLVPGIAAKLRNRRAHVLRARVSAEESPVHQKEEL